MDYGEFFFREIEGLHQEGRYRVFADLERQAGAFPRATRHAADSRQQVTVWCSNDYVGMGGHTRPSNGHSRRRHQRVRSHSQLEPVVPLELLDRQRIHQAGGPLSGQTDFMKVVDWNWGHD